ncbi:MULTISPECIES: metal ABC transporter permease [Cohnella]|uniref:metal ABC transporter permease n=1 Tax=Cohnella TaxID=329857 RepID=UPI0009B9559C|nr:MULTISPECIES: metal ABC transporter permease [Cohnella]MBN2981427.1 metal ABC transporter permease [Cohnella algarum]
MSGFWIMLVGAMVAACCAILGSFLVLRRMALVGDAISHSVLPGIVIAFLVSGSRDSFFMLLGAALVGFVTVFLIQMFQSSGLQSDASIGVVFTALFAVGVVLVSLNARNIDLDLDCVLFGEIAYVQWNVLEIGGTALGPKAVWLVGFALLAIVAVVGLFYKQFKICAFDPALALALGIPVAVFHYALMGLVSLATVSSFESVGAVLVVGLLVIPPSAAYLLTDRLGRMIGIAVGIGVASSVAGYYAAVWLDASIAGCMVCAAGAQFALAFLFSPKHGLAAKRRRRLRSALAGQAG